MQQKQKVQDEEDEGEWYKVDDNAKKASQPRDPRSRRNERGSHSPQEERQQ